jgi:hypothetical protein
MAFRPDPNLGLPRTPGSRAGGRRLLARTLHAAFDQPPTSQRRPKRVDQGREGAEVGGEFFAGVAEGLDPGWARRSRGGSNWMKCQLLSDLRLHILPISGDTPGNGQTMVILPDAPPCYRGKPTPSGEVQPHGLVL